MLLWPFKQLDRLWRWLGFESERSRRLLTIILVSGLAVDTIELVLRLPTIVHVLSLLTFSPAGFLVVHRGLRRAGVKSPRVQWRFASIAMVLAAVPSLEKIVHLPTYTTWLTVTAAVVFVGLHHFATASGRRERLEGFGILLSIGGLALFIADHTEKGTAADISWMMGTSMLVLVGWLAVFVADALSARWYGQPVYWLSGLLAISVFPISMLVLSNGYGVGITKAVAYWCIAGWGLAWVAALAYVGLGSGRAQAGGVLA